MAAEVRKNNAAAQDTVAKALGLASGMDMALLGGAANVAELLTTWGEEGVRALAAEVRKGRNGILAEGWGYVEELRATWGVETVIKIADLVHFYNIGTPKEYVRELLHEHGGGGDGARAEIARRAAEMRATMEENRRTAALHAKAKAERAETVPEARRSQPAAEARVVPAHDAEFLARREAANADHAAKMLARKRQRMAATAGKRDVKKRDAKERDADERDADERDAEERDVDKTLPQNSVRKPQRPRS